MVLRFGVGAFRFGVSLLAGLSVGLFTPAMAQSGLPYNRAVSGADIRYEVNPDGSADRPFMVTGIVRYEVEPVGTFDLSCSVAVFINGNWAGGGPGPGGSCGDPGTTQKVNFAPGLPIVANPPMFDCTQFCASCFGYDVNICIPPSVSPNPICMCQQECIPFRVTGFGVPVAALDANDIIEVVLSVYDTGLPEIDPSDDIASVRAGDAMACIADLTGDRVLDLADINAFVAGFMAGEPVADLAAPQGVWDLSDVNAFVSSFVAGCP